VDRSASTAPSKIAGTSESLLQKIEDDPAGTLGPYGEQLPFLLKVLAVDAPLSLQVHPDAEQAKAGFAREAASGTRSGRTRTTSPSLS